MKRLVKNGFLTLFTIGSCVATYMAFEKLYNKKENISKEKLDNELESIDEYHIDIDPDPK
ncbi:MAG: hypothetical protein FWC47_01150 [Oscillospiraceae bacterium]|nr:hypothetical protein [Oscillospiraceae bacterium]